MVKNAIKEVLLVFRAKLHSATGLTSSGVVFRHKYRGSYPNKKCTEFHSAIPKMIKEKKARCVDINTACGISQWVYIKNQSCRSKLQPLYFQEP